MAEQLTNNAQTTVASGLSNLTDPVTFVVTSAALFPTTGTFHILVGSELLLVTAVSGTSWTVSRAQEGTGAAPHANGDMVTEVLTTEALDRAIVDRVSLGTQDFRLTLASGVPISTTDQAAKTRVYCTPYQASRSTRARAGSSIRVRSSRSRSAPSRRRSRMTCSAMPAASRPRWNSSPGPLPPRGPRRSRDRTGSS